MIVVNEGFQAEQKVPKQLLSYFNWGMKTFTIIRSDDQYRIYCDDLEQLTSAYKIKPSQELLDIIDTIGILLEKYDEQHPQLKKVDPIQLMKSLMEENNINQKKLADTLQISKGHLSDILNYKKGLSKKIIRSLSHRFKLEQDAFSQPYKFGSDLESEWAFYYMDIYQKLVITPTKSTIFPWSKLIFYS